mgnify:CR=1 FL=1
MLKVGAAIAIGAAALTFLPSDPAMAEVLITKAEAELPAMPNIAITTRGLTRGPGIEQLSPNPDRGVPSPLSLRVKFQIRNHIEIDQASIKLTYLKAKPIDLTDRIKAYIKPDGIEIVGPPLDRNEAAPVGPLMSHEMALCKSSDSVHDRCTHRGKRSGPARNGPACHCTFHE